MSEKEIFKKVLTNCKLDLSYNGLMNESEIYGIIICDQMLDNKENLKIYNPFFKLIENFNDIVEIMKANDLKVMECFFLNNKRIHTILFKEDKQIFMDTNIIINFCDYFYLDCMIRYQSELINYKYNYNLIKELYSKMNLSDFGIKKIILSIMLLNYIENYLEGAGDDDGQYEKELNKMKEVCFKNFSDYKNDLNKYGINLEVNDNSIDISVTDIYCDILIFLIKNNKLNDSDETINLLTQLEIKTLRLDQQVFKALSEVINEENLSKYQITKYEDFFDKNKLIFYNILFEYILKRPQYVFYIPFLLETRNKIIEIIRNKRRDLLSKFKNNKNDMTLDILRTVLGYFIEVDFYLDKNVKINTQKKEQINPSEGSKKVNSNSNSNNNVNNNSNNNSKNNSNNNSNTNSSFFNNNSKDSNSQNSSNMSDQSSDSYKAFEGESFKNKSNQGSYSYYEINENQNIDITKEESYYILKQSDFKMKISYDKNNDIASIEYIEIIFKNANNEDERIEINKVKELTSNNTDLNNCYREFVYYLDSVEDALKKKYKKENPTEIIMEFRMESRYTVNCLFKIIDDSLDENEFNVNNFTNNNDLSGIELMIEKVCE